MPPDTITSLGAAVALILAISLAGERIVAIVKTLFPGWFAEPDPAAPPPAPGDDRWRRLRVQAVAFAACWAATAAAATDGFVGSIRINDALSLPVALVALLAMGGSAFWAQIIGITSALKDVKNTQVAALHQEPPAPAAPASAKVRVPAPLVGAASDA